MWLHAIGLLVTFGIGLLWAPLAAEAQQTGKVYRIGYISYTRLTMVKRDREARRLFARPWIV